MDEICEVFFNVVKEARGVRFELGAVRGYAVGLAEGTDLAHVFREDLKTFLGCGFVFSFFLHKASFDAGSLVCKGQHGENKEFIFQISRQIHKLNSVVINEGGSVNDIANTLMGKLACQKSCESRFTLNGKAS